MYKITLLSSIHCKLGKCNSDELYRIIENLEPEIIFEELSNHIFVILYTDEYIPQSLEAFTIKEYLKTYSISHFPVDTHVKNEVDLFNGHNSISSKSNEYNELFNRQISMIITNGFSFLNSDEYSELLSNISAIERKVLHEINNEMLSRQYQQEIQLHDKRENEMLKNIYNYSKQFQYRKALFICGAEHRKPFLNKIPEFEKREEINLNWSFYGS